MLVLPWIHIQTIPIGPLNIQVWGLTVAIGILVSTYLFQRAVTPKGITKETVIDLVLVLIISGFLGARLYHVFAYQPLFFLSNPLELFKIWQGGFSSFGGLFGSAFGLWFFEKKRGTAWRKHLSFPELLDKVIKAAIPGWLIARFGCVLIHDHIGQECPNCQLAFATPMGDRLDMAFLEIIFLLPFYFFWMLWEKYKRFAGQGFSIMMIFYGLLRIGLDFFRATDIVHADARYFGLTPGQYAGMAFVLIGVFLYLRWSGKKIDD